MSTGKAKEARTRLKRWPIALALVGASAVLVEACSGTTEILVHVTTNATCATVAGSLHFVTLGIATGAPSKIDVRSPAGTSTTCGKLTEHFEGDFGPSDLGTLALVPGGAKDGPLEVVVVATVNSVSLQDVPLDTCLEWAITQVPASGYRNFADPDVTLPVMPCLVARRSLTFTPHESFELPIQLDAKCAGVTCGPGLTCENQACITEKTVCKPGDKTCQVGGQGGAASTSSSGSASVTAGQTTASSVTATVSVSNATSNASTSKANSATNGATTVSNGVSTVSSVSNTVGVTSTVTSTGASTCMMMCAACTSAPNSCVMPSCTCCFQSVCNNSCAPDTGFCTATGCVCNTTNTSSSTGVGPTSTTAVTTVGSSSSSGCSCGMSNCVMPYTCMTAANCTCQCNAAECNPFCIFTGKAGGNCSAGSPSMCVCF